MKLRPLAAFVAAACFYTAPALANPVNATVVNGTAAISQSGNVLTVQTSNGAVINWDKFNIGASEVTRFVQTSASSAVLNRVLNDPTAIYGTLSSNGRVWLVNPSGIMVGSRTSRINVNTLVAPRQSTPASVPSLPPTLTTTSLPQRGTLAVAAPARMVDGAVTLRMPLVDASAITIR